VSAHLFIGKMTMPMIYVMLTKA